MTAWWHFARAQAYARGGKVDDAIVERSALVQTTARVPESALFGGTGLVSAKTALAVAITATVPNLGLFRYSIRP